MFYDMPWPQLRLLIFIPISMFRFRLRIRNSYGLRNHGPDRPFHNFVASKSVARR